MEVRKTMKKTMKRGFACLLALAMMLCLSITSFAVDSGTADQSSVTVTKVYKLAGEGTSPAETFTLQQVGDGEVTDGDATSAPALGTITGAQFAVGAATADGAEGTITIALPTYDKVGVYEYTLKEIAGSTAGVTYYGDTMKLVVTVTNGTDGLVRTAAIHTEKSGDKADSFANTYSANTLKVTKTVTGNLGDKSKYFEFTVKLTGEEGKTYADSYAITKATSQDTAATIEVGGEATVYLKDGETISIANLPAGVTYTVTETAVDGYKTTSTGESGTISAEAASAAAFTNDKSGEIDTGVILSSAPYVVILAVVAAAAVAFVIKKRRA